MNKIQVEVLNPQALQEAEKLMVLGARLTQRGHKVQTMGDLIKLYERPFEPELVWNLAELPHPTIQKLETVTVAVVGASRRFLAQITRHQNEVKFVSASLQYSDYSGHAQFVVPYEILELKGTVQTFQDFLRYQATCYDMMVKLGIDNDTAGYVMPQALRNVLLISATPYQWKHMIGQRVCRRNTPETRYVMLRIWQQLIDLSPALFASHTTGPFCMRDSCKEGSMCCGHSLGMLVDPTQILHADFPLLMKKENDDGTEP